MIQDKTCVLWYERKNSASRHVRLENLGNYYEPKLTRLTLHVDWLVSLDEDCHGPGREPKICLVDKSSSPNKPIIISFHTESVISFHNRFRNLERKGREKRGFRVSLSHSIPIQSSVRFVPFIKILH
jgi:hypothetical protein